MGNNSSDKKKTMPIETMFKLPSPLPIWPQGEGFATGSINIGGLDLCQISTFRKVWATHEGGPGNLGATFYEPSELPVGYFMLGCYSQPNNKPLFGWVLAAKDDEQESSAGIIASPMDYKLVWSSESIKMKQDGKGYIWLPIAPDGYEALGHIVTNSSEKPPLENVRCVRSDFTEKCENGIKIWNRGGKNSGVDVYGLRPIGRGTQALGVCVGTFFAQLEGTTSPTTLSCLKNKSSNFSSMPNQKQTEALMQTYSPWVYFHPKEKYLPSSVSWYFSNGALLYEQGKESNPVSVNPNGSNLPQGGSNDGTYWLDLPTDAGEKEKVKKGNLESAQVYCHVKSMLGGTFTDIQIWVFCPFNGPAKAKATLVSRISLGKTGQHVGDWEHVTLRISNFTGELWKVFFSQHSGGTWVEASQLEFQEGNKAVIYASLNGHALYPKQGLVLQGNTKLGVGIRNDTSTSRIVMDTGKNFEVVSVEYLGNTVAIVEPPWLNFTRKWGPKINYDSALKKAQKLLPVNLPREMLGEDGPTGPKMKRNWNGDEI